MFPNRGQKPVPIADTVGYRDVETRLEALVKTLINMRNYRFSHDDRMNMLVFLTPRHNVGMSLNDMRMTSPMFNARINSQ